MVGDFEGGRLSTDGGALLLREADALLDLTPRLAACFEDHRSQRRVEHPVRQLVSQRLFGLLLGYEDVNDQLRADSVLALAVGRSDLTGEERVRERDRGNPLAGSSTVNRLELGVPGEAETHRYKKVAVGAMDDLKIDLSLDACPSPPKEIFLDVDSTDDPVHGNQEGRHFHGYYDSYCYLPLYIVWDDLILCSRLRPANVDPAAGTEEELARIVERIRKRWPKTRIVVRGDGGFCRDDLMTWCEDNGVDYLFGLSRNARLTERIGRQLRKSRSRCVSTGAASRRFCDFRYRTRTSWSRTRRVVAKAEWLPGPRGLNARFVVTSLGCKRAGARVLYEKLYCARGEMENRIKEQQLDLFADRTSTATMRANQLRLDFATFASHGGDSEGWPGRHRGRQGAGRDDSDETSQGRRLHPHFGSEGSALVFFGLALEGSVRPGPGEPAGGCAADPNLTPLAASTALFRKPETPATGQVCSGAGSHGIGVARNRKRSWFVQEKPSLPTAPCFSGPPVVQKTAPATRNWPLDSLL